MLILDSWSIVFGSTALPLDLLGFSGYAYAGYNELQWSTASEKNTASFDIQRTVDGVTYQTIGKVAATGFGSNQYSFRDQGHTSGVNLYRLRMTDNSGEYTYSKTVKISGKTEKEAGIKFAPNPVKDIFNITVTDKALLHTEGKIINSLGQVVYTFKIDQENIRHNLSHLPAGVYFIRLNSGNHTRFVKEN
ncbi:MAG: T9SS type A sorting domain-containing protein [Sphingobacteriales bacterium]|nr:MAG: T9SS type A sorting domain-containing protein [Sphingobacteriales bacterium]